MTVPVRNYNTPLESIPTELWAVCWSAQSFEDSDYQEYHGTILIRARVGPDAEAEVEDAVIDWLFEHYPWDPEVVEAMVESAYPVNDTNLPGVIWSDDPEVWEEAEVEGP